MPDSNRNWKNRYFFVKKTEWICRPKEWASMPDKFDNSYGIVKESNELLMSFLVASSVLVMYLTLCSFLFFSSSLSRGN